MISTCNSRPKTLNTSRHTFVDQDHRLIPIANRNSHRQIILESPQPLVIRVVRFFRRKPQPWHRRYVPTFHVGHLDGQAGRYATGIPSANIPLSPQTPIKPPTHIPCPHALPPFLLLFTLLPFLGREILCNLSKGAQQDPLVIRKVGPVDQTLLASSDLDSVGEVCPKPG